MKIQKEMNNGKSCKIFIISVWLSYLRTGDTFYKIKYNPYNKVTGSLPVWLSVPKDLANC